jgi:two-component system, cell cycle sensor histidine kinase and response regulator CckA
MNILVIDNDPIFLRFIEKFLVGEGHTVLTAQDGLSALDALKSFSPDIFFIDYVMPNIDGKAFCHLLRNDTRYKSTYIVLLSAIAAEEWTDLKNIGADACIAKGPLSRMKGYIGDVLKDPGAAAKYCAAGNIIGIEDVFPRLITRELLDSRTHFQLLLEKMSEGILELNSDDRVVFANPIARRILGQSADSILGCLLVDLLPRSQNHIVANLLDGKNRSEKMDCAGELIEAGPRFITMKFVPLMSPGGHSLIILNDVSEHKRAENSLRETNEFLRSILNSSYSISIISTDLDQNILFWNQGSEALFGYTSGEVVGIHKIDILYPGPQEKKLADDLRSLLQREKKEVSCELAEKAKDGRILMMKLHLSPRFDQSGEVIGILGIGEDITQQKKAEERLAQSEARYRQIFNVAPAGIYELDFKTGRLTSVNDAVCEYTGYTRDELLSSSVLDLLSPQSQQKYFDRMDKMVRGVPVPEIVEYTAVKKDGSLFTMSLNAKFTYEGQTPVGATVVVHDITERKKLERQLYQAQKMKSLGTLAGGVAHDFNNLLMGIQGRASIMKMNVESPAKLQEHLHGIEEYVKSAANLTKQLLGFARGGKYEVKSIDLNDFVKNQCQLFGRTRKDITIHEKYEKNLWTVEADQGQIEQVLLNIFVNAWQAMPGGGDLYLQSENCVIEEKDVGVHHVNPGKFAKISITDTGIGMEPEVVDRIFDPFFTTKEVGRGTGLGLASAYGIICNHGGFIEVYSEKNRGSTFCLYLPATEKMATFEKEPDEKIMKGHETLLLVDDEEMILDVGRDILAVLGYKVLVAGGGSEALDVYRANRTRIDMVILDMVMPAMDGREVYRRLKEINPEIKVLLSSGFSINGQAAEIIEMGCDGFIQKPFTMGGLSVKIRKILDGD